MLVKLNVWLTVLSLQRSLGVIKLSICDMQLYGKSPVLIIIPFSFFSIYKASTIGNKSSFLPIDPLTKIHYIELLSFPI